MDHAGDMLWYIHRGLREAWDYPGIRVWGDIDAYTEQPPEDPSWEVRGREFSRAIMYAKDGTFEVTVRHLDDSVVELDGDLKDAPEGRREVTT